MPVLFCPTLRNFSFFVIPAKAGIQGSTHNSRPDSRFRGYDD
jgi:hypothetical protein